jgi:putative tricarboxylic transport membrane protein
VSKGHASPSRSWTALVARQDFVGGVVGIGLAAFAFWQSADLPMGTLGGMGPGMLPKALSVALGALCALLVAEAVLEGGPKLERWTIRGPLFVLGAVIIFGLAVRPLGLIVAGPLAIGVSALASAEVRWLETIVVGLVVTAFCIGLFKFALGLPIPLAPWLIGY